MATLETIKPLIQHLPHKDIAHALKFMELKDIESLKQIVDSAIYKIKKEKLAEDFITRRTDECVNCLETLKAEVDEYYFSIENTRIREADEDDESNLSYDALDEIYYGD